MSPDPYTPYPPSSYGAPNGAGPVHDDNMAWAGIACSVASWLFCCCTPIPFLGLIGNGGGLLLSIAGVVCGVLSRRAAQRAGGRTDLPTIAIVIGGLRLVVTLGLLGLALVLVAIFGVAAFAEYAQRAGH